MRGCARSRLCEESSPTKRKYFEKELAALKLQTRGLEQQMILLSASGDEARARRRYRPDAGDGAERGQEAPLGDSRHRAAVRGQVQRVFNFVTHAKEKSLRLQQHVLEPSGARALKRIEKETRAQCERTRQLTESAAELDVRVAEQDGEIAQLHHNAAGEDGQHGARDASRRAGREREPGALPAGQPRPAARAPGHEAQAQSKDATIKAKENEVLSRAQGRPEDGRADVLCVTV